MKKSFRFTFVFLLILMSMQSYAQRWKAYRYEFLFGAGAADFLGELGGTDKIASHSIRDLEWKATRPAATVGLRYKMSEYTAIRANLRYGRLSGNDKLTKEYFRNYRNVNFFSNIYELSANFEGAILKESSGRKYRLRGVKGRRGYEVYFYGFTGISVFHFNPKTRDENGKVVALQPLHTEGQSLIPSRKPYHRTAVSIPIGFGIKYGLNKRWSLGIEYGFRYAFSDYIDDVSTTYVNPTLLSGQANGETAAKLANRSNNNDPYGPGSSSGITAQGQQRGDPRYNDAYMFAIVSLNYKLRSVRGSLPKF